MRKPVESLSAEQLARLQADWRAGLLPPRTIAVKFGVEVDEVRAYAAKAGWEDSELTRQIAHEVQRAVVERTVSDHQRASGKSQPQLIDNKQLVQQFGQILASVTQEQQREVSAARRYVNRLMHDLEALEPPEVDEQAINALANLIGKDNPDLAKQMTGAGKLVNVDQRVKDIERRSGIVLRLAQAIKMLIETERLVWGMGKTGTQQTNDYDALLDHLIEISQQQARLN